MAETGYQGSMDCNHSPSTGLREWTGQDEVRPTHLQVRVADLPTFLYLLVLVRKLAGSTSVFLKIQTEFPESMEIVTWTNASLLPVKPIVERWWGVIVHWHLHISSHFQDWSILLVLIGQKSLLNQSTSTLHQNFTDVSHPPIIMVGLNPKLLVIRDCMKPTKRRKNAQN